MLWDLSPGLFLSFLTWISLSSEKKSFKNFLISEIHEHMVTQLFSSRYGVYDVGARMVITHKINNFLCWCETATWGYFAIYLHCHLLIWYVRGQMNFDFCYIVCRSKDSGLNCHPSPPPFPFFPLLILLAVKKKLFLVKIREQTNAPFCIDNGLSSL